MDTVRSLVGVGSTNTRAAKITPKEATLRIYTLLEKFEALEKKRYEIIKTHRSKAVASAKEGNRQKALQELRLCRLTQAAIERICKIQFKLHELIIRLDDSNIIIETSETMKECHLVLKKNVSEIKQRELEETIEQLDDMLGIANQMGRAIGDASFSDEMDDADLEAELDDIMRGVDDGNGGNASVLQSGYSTPRTYYTNNPRTSEVLAAAVAMAETLPSVPTAAVVTRPYPKVRNPPQLANAQ